MANIKQIQLPGGTTYDIEDSTARGDIASKTLQSLSDVAISSPTSGQSLMYNGTSWVNGSGAGTGDMQSATYDPNGNVATAGGIPAYVSSQVPDVSGKADKVSSATDGNFAGLDSNGNLIDSGSKASDFSTTDANVTQTATTTDDQYEVLFSGTADNTTRTEGVCKDNGFFYNPNKNAVTVGGARLNGYAIGSSSFVNGASCAASGGQSFAQGNTTRATGSDSHAEGNSTLASGSCAHAEGKSTTASGSYSHASGDSTVAGYSNQTAIGKYNDNKSTSLFEVGNGTSSSRSNAFEVYSDGTLSTDNGSTKHKLGVLQINPTDNTFKTTPGAIWIEG